MKLDKEFHNQSMEKCFKKLCKVYDKEVSKSSVAGMEGRPQKRNGHGSADVKRPWIVQMYYGDETDSTAARKHLKL